MENTIVAKIPGTLPVPKKAMMGMRIYKGRHGLHQIQHGLDNRIDPLASRTPDTQWNAHQNAKDSSRTDEG